MTEKIYLHMRSCVSGRQQNHKKIKKNQERIIRHCLKKNVPAGSNAYLRICYFLKNSQPKEGPDEDRRKNTCKKYVFYILGNSPTLPIGEGLECLLNSLNKC